MPVRERPPARLLAAIAAGGAVGSVGRYAVGLALPHYPGTFPIATFLVNLTGAVAIGVLVGYLVARPHAPAYVRPVLGVGVLGGWTTYSAFAVEVVELMDAGRWAAAASYVTGTLFLGTLAVSLGARIARTAWEPSS